MAIARRPQVWNCCSYLEPVLRSTLRRSTVKKAVEILKTVEFDTIACTGMSGALSASMVALLLKKDLCLVRKPRENSHSYRSIEARHRVGRFIFMDDLIGTGETKRRTVEEVKKHDKKAVYVGSYLYKGGGWVSAGTSE